MWPPGVTLHVKQLIFIITFPKKLGLDLFAIKSCKKIFHIFKNEYIQGSLTSAFLNTLLRLSPLFFAKYPITIQGYQFFWRYHLVFFYHIFGLQDSRFFELETKWNKKFTLQNHINIVHSWKLLGKEWINNHLWNKS